MEIESIEIKAHGGKIIIPEGYKAVVKDGIVTIEKEEVQKFKDGDILAYVDYSDYRCPFIYKNTDTRGRHQFYVGVNIGGRLVLSDTAEKRWGDGVLQHATEEEKQLLFDEMKEEGLRWNAEEKRVEKIRWRAEDGKKYYLVGNQGSVMIDIEGDYCIDKKRHKSGNYFRTSEQAEEAARRVKETLRKYHEEIGE